MLDTSYRTGDDSSDYLNYLRGDRTHEKLLRRHWQCQGLP